MTPLNEALPEFDTAEDAPRLHLALGAYDGPLDLMLDLARREKIDLSALSMLALADQYLAFIAAARALRLEVAADYLVMAAWLTWLKSRLLLPRAEDSTGPDAEEMAGDLAARLERLALFRRLAGIFEERLAGQEGARPRGLAEATLATPLPGWQVALNELLVAYATNRLASVRSFYQVAQRRCLSIPQARAALERLVGASAAWCPLSLLLSALKDAGEEADARSATASGLVAALEMAREGRLALRQEAAFAPIYLRNRAVEGAP